jgi:hypothetical protein
VGGPSWGDGFALPKEAPAVTATVKQTSTVAQPSTPPKPSADSATVFPPKAPQSGAVSDDDVADEDTHLRWGGYVPSVNGSGWLPCRKLGLIHNLTEAT